MLATRGGRRVVLIEPMGVLPPTLALTPVTYAPPRLLDAVKSLSYAANMLASRLACEQGFDEALLVTPHGRVLEAPTSSVFWVQGQLVLTPPLTDHILASITRSVVIDVAGAQERACTLDELAAADEVFLASTTREVQPVAAVDERTFARSGLVTERVAAQVSAAIQSELGS
jgi:branched-chain amino acid aminotransferase